jgi:V8-like Glu-specific endopeptidase
MTAPENVATYEGAIRGGRIASAYPEAVLVDMKKGNRVVAACSGSLIAPTVVLTAGHCVVGFDGWRITAPYASEQRASSNQAVTLYGGRGHSVDPDTHDVGLVFLSSPIELDTYPTLASEPLNDGAEVVNIGRIQDGVRSDSHLYASAPLAVTSAEQDGFPFDYIADELIESGDSGGPDMASGTHTIVAVNSGAGGGTEVLARIDLVKSWIEEKIAAHEDEVVEAE